MRIKVEGFGEDQNAEGLKFPNVAVHVFNDDGTSAKGTLPKQSLPNVEVGKEYDLQLIAGRRDGRFAGLIFVPVGGRPAGALHKAA